MDENSDVIIAFIAASGVLPVGIALIRLAWSARGVPGARKLHWKLIAGAAVGVAACSFSWLCVFFGLLLVSGVDKSHWHPTASEVRNFLILLSGVALSVVSVQFLLGSIWCDRQTGEPSRRFLWITGFMPAWPIGWAWCLIHEGWRQRLADKL